MTNDEDRARNQARMQMENVAELVTRLQHAEGTHEECDHLNNVDCFEMGECDSSEEYHDDDKAREAIQEDALHVQVRSDWVAAGDALEPAEYNILLCTGGPAVRIIGDLTNNEPDSARLEYQDWGTPWTEYREADEDTLLQYAKCFYFGGF